MSDQNYDDLCLICDKLEGMLKDEFLRLKGSLKLITNSKKLSQRDKLGIVQNVMIYLSMLDTNISTINNSCDNILSKFVSVDEEIMLVGNDILAKLKLIHEKVSPSNELLGLHGDEFNRLYGNLYNVLCLAGKTDDEKRQKYDKLMLVGADVDDFYDKVIGVKQKTMK